MPALRVIRVLQVMHVLRVPVQVLQLYGAGLWFRVLALQLYVRSYSFLYWLYSVAVHALLRLCECVVDALLLHL